MRRRITAFSIFLFVFSLYSQAQVWSPLLSSNAAIDWSKSGVGGIPARTTNCASLTSSATVAQINSALASCASGQTVSLAAGTYSVTGNINVPSNVTLRGAGANLTILNATGSGGNVVNLGSGSVSYKPINITSGATAGSTSIAVSNAAGISAGTYLVVTETNNSSYVSTAGSEGTCTWCDGSWTSNGSLARGQIVAVTAVSGTTLTISPGLYGAYTNTPVAVPFSMSASYAGVEDLQVYANNTGYSANFGISTCAYCWVKGVESNYTDGDHVDAFWGYHDEIRDSYFSNSFLHTPGSHDSDVDLAYKTSATLVENNIVERTHVAIMMEWGAAGNVISYNYTMGEFDAGSTNVVIGGISFHGAHPQYNLLEGNVVTQIYPDSVWGTSSQTTAFRNWAIGTNHICNPTSGRGTISCSGTNGHYGFQAARAMQISYLSTKNNFVGNVVGSAQDQSLLGYTNPVAQTASIEYPAVRSYDAVAFGWSFGYGELSDDGTGTGCVGGVASCHASGTSTTDLSTGNYNNIGSSVLWASGVAQTLPPSFYLAGQPSWWGSIPFPATGPDVTGGTGPGGHSFGNPAETCYVNVMKGSDGGAGGPLTFNASSCYGTSTSGSSGPLDLTGTVK
jgi:Pectate lyase superfamily protein